MKLTSEYSELGELSNLQSVQKHYELFREAKFDWEAELPSVKKIIEFVTNPILSLTNNSLDSRFVDSTIFQEIFPLELIDKYLDIVHGDTKSEAFEKSIELQSALLEVFLWHHLRYDTRFSPLIESDYLGSTSFPTRVSIRHAN